MNKNIIYVDASIPHIMLEMLSTAGKSRINLSTSWIHCFRFLLLTFNL